MVGSEVVGERRRKDRGAHGFDSHGVKNLHCLSVDYLLGFYSTRIKFLRLRGGLGAPETRAPLKQQQTAHATSTRPAARPSYSTASSQTETRKKVSIAGRFILSSYSKLSPSGYYSGVPREQPTGKHRANKDRERELAWTDCLHRLSNGLTFRS